MPLKERIATDPFSFWALLAAAALTALPLATTQTCFMPCPPPRTISLLAEPMGVIAAFVLPLLGAAWLATSPRQRRGRVLALLLVAWVVAALLAMVLVREFVFTRTDAHEGAYAVLLATLVAAGSLLNGLRTRAEAVQ